MSVIISDANAAGIISARKQAALRAVLRSDLRVQRACARPFSPCELPRLSPALVSRMAFQRLSGASIRGKGLRVGASFSRPLGPDRHYCRERKLSERAPFDELQWEDGYSGPARSLAVGPHARARYLYQAGLAPDKEEAPTGETGLLRGSFLGGTTLLAIRAASASRAENVQGPSR